MRSACFVCTVTELKCHVEFHEKIPDAIFRFEEIV